MHGVVAFLEFSTKAVRVVSGEVWLAERRMARTLDTYDARIEQDPGLVVAEDVLRHCAGAVDDDCFVRVGCGEIWTVERRIARRATLTV